MSISLASAEAYAGAAFPLVVATKFTPHPAYPSARESNLPLLKRRSFIGQVAVRVVDAREARDLVTPHPLDMSLQDTKGREGAGHGVAKVVKGPVAATDESVRSAFRSGIPARRRPPTRDQELSLIHI